MKAESRKSARYLHLLFQVRLESPLVIESTVLNSWTANNLVQKYQWVPFLLLASQERVAIDISVHIPIIGIFVNDLIEKIHHLRCKLYNNYIHNYKHFWKGVYLCKLRIKLEKLPALCNFEQAHEIFSKIKILAVQNPFQIRVHVVVRKKLHDIRCWAVVTTTAQCRVISQATTWLINVRIRSHKAKLTKYFMLKLML